MSRTKDALIEAADRAAVMRGTAEEKVDQIISDATVMLYQLDWLIEQEGCSEELARDVHEALKALRNVIGGLR